MNVACPKCSADEKPFSGSRRATLTATFAVDASLLCLSLYDSAQPYPHVTIRRGVSLSRFLLLSSGSQVQVLPGAPDISPESWVFFLAVFFG